MSGICGARELTLAVVLFSLAGAFACTPPPEKATEPKELETVDVTAAPDAALSTAGDAQERRATSALAGALPDGFPKDLPVLSPSSLVDFAERPGGGYTAAFDTPAAPASVRAALASRLAGFGWRDAGGGVWTKPDRQVTLAVEPTPMGARFTYSY
jgi:hypothetical protein